jgi:S-adenosylmethionine decarboxylase
MMMPRGHHIIAEFRKCDPKKIMLVSNVKPILEKSVVDSGLTKLSSSYHQFEPFGVTGFVLLSESHISLHTWPEKKYIAIDLFTCGPKKKALKAFDVLCEGFKPREVKKMELDRE